MVFIAQRSLSHIGEFDRSLGTRVHKPVAACRVEFSGRNHLRQLLHVGGFNIDNIETLVLDVEVPQIHSEVIAANEGFAITVDGDAIYVIRMGVGVCSSGDGGDDGIMVCHPRELQCRWIFERYTRSPGSATSSTDGTSGREIAGEIVFRDDLERLIKHLPQFNRLVIG